MGKLIALGVICLAPAGVAQGALTPHRAAVAFKHELADQYSSRWTHARPAWVDCPKQEIFALGGSGPKTALCMAQFKRHGRWRYVSGSVNARLHADLSYARSWVRKWRRAGHKCLHGADLSGRLWSNTGACEAQMAGDIAFLHSIGKPVRRVGSHGTNTAGFEHLVLFRCHQCGSGWQCVNPAGRRNPLRAVERRRADTSTSGSLTLSPG